MKGIGPVSIAHNVPFAEVCSVRHGRTKLGILSMSIKADRSEPKNSALSHPFELHLGECYTPVQIRHLSRHKGLALKEGTFHTILLGMNGSVWRP